METDTKHYKNLLESELKTLEMELKTVGRKNPQNSADWEATEKREIDTADEEEVADSMEEYENNKAILNQLEARFNEVTTALKKIEGGTYGKCDVCGVKIEKDRLDANSAAQTCKLHM